MRLSLLCLAWLAGILLSALDLLEGAALLSAGSLALWGLARPRPPLWGVVALALFVAGGVRHRGAEAALTFPVLEGLRGGEAVLVARVSEEPEPRGSRQLLVLTVTAAGHDGAADAATGSVMAWLPLYPQYHQDELLEVRGRLEAPRERPGSDSAGLLARRGIVGFLNDPQIRVLGTRPPAGWRAWPARARRALSEALAAALPEPEASLAAALLFGARTTLPSSVNEAFQATGTSHLLAVSGYNLTLVTIWIGTVFVLALGRRRALWPSLAAAWAYALLVGDQPPVLRAAAMASLALAATSLGRPASGVAALALSAAVFAALDPLVLGEPSFQLSFLAVAGLFLLADPWQRHLEIAFDGLQARLRFGAGPLRVVANTLAVTSAASLVTVPLIALLFQRLAVITPLANLVAQPLVPVAMALSMPAALTGLLLPDLAPYVAAPAWVALHGLTTVVEGLARVPGASLATPPLPGSIIAAFYAALAVGLLGHRWGLWPALRRVVRAVPGLKLEASLAGASLIVWTVVLIPAEGDVLSLEVLDVGQGDSLLVTAPSGRRVLIDGGPDPQRLLQLLGQRLPFWERRFAALIVTHPQTDHLTGLLAVAERYRVDLVVEGDADDSPLHAAWSAILERRRIARVHPSPGQALRLDSAVMTVLGPTPDQEGGSNDRSLVLRLVYGEVSFLLTGDIEAAGEEALVHSRYPIASTVLKVAHHGSRTSTTPRFLDAVGPAVSAISVGTSNPFGHPSPEVLQRLEGRRVFRTDLHGTISYRTDGRRLWVHTER